MLSCSTYNGAGVVANSVSLANGFKTGSGTDEYKCSALAVSPNARHWLEGDMSMEIECASSIPMLTCEKEQKVIKTNSMRRVCI